MSVLKRIGFLFAFIMPALLLWGHYRGGWWNLSAFVFAYGLVPLIDAVVGRDAHNVAEHESPKLWQEPYFTGILYALVLTQTGLLGYTAYWMATSPASWPEVLAYTLSFMTVTSNGINIAHELGHRNERFPQLMGLLALMEVYYMHFFIEHNRGHHVHVGTPLDPATSRKGQHFYQFWKQTFFGGWRSAWDLEKKRLQRAGLSGRHSAMIPYSILPLVLALVLFGAASLLAQQAVWPFLAFFFGQAFLAASSLEAVNYIEHYGLYRKEIGQGRYERVNTLHSWNANHLVSNLLLFQLQRHSDHHAHAAKPYQVLRHEAESPQLPAGYPLMILMALVPPLWFKVMNRRLEAWEKSTA